MRESVCERERVKWTDLLISNTEKFGLTKDAEDYRYLTRGNTTRVSGVDDWQNFWETKVNGHRHRREEN